MDCTVAPHDNVIENNIITGKHGNLLEIIEAPDNVIRNKLLHQTADYR